MNTLYLDIFSGISGDMFLGAMLDLGVDFQKLERELKKLPVEGYHLHAGKGFRSNIAGIKFDVHLEGDESHDHGHHHGEDHEHDHDHAHHHEHEHEHVDEHGKIHRHSHAHEHSHPESGHGHEHAHEPHEHEHGHGRSFADIRQLISRSELSSWVKEKSMAIFYRVAVAEAKIHGTTVEAVHFHEVGAVDSIVDIVGATIALELLGRPRVLAARVVEGTGWVDCAHGRFPVPTAATLEILGTRGIPITQCEEPHELVTPTGAALLAELVENFGPMEGLVAKKVGYGLGSRENKTRPNVLRAVLGSTETKAVVDKNDWEADTVAVLETNLDDLSPEIVGSLLERMMKEGALDVFFQPVQMKKNRPGILLTVLCGPADADSFTKILLTETSAFGVRRTVMERKKLAREIVSVSTQFGEVKLKLGRLNGRVVQAAPEFESCRALAEKIQRPLKEIYELAVKSFEQHRHD